MMCILALIQSRITNSELSGMSQAISKASLRQRSEALIKTDEINAPNKALNAYARQPPSRNPNAPAGTA
jgi:hypothetical protein